MRSHEHIYLSCILITESKLFIIYYHCTELYIITHTNHCTGYNSIKYMRMEEWGIKEVGSGAGRTDREALQLYVYCTQSE